MNGEAIQFAANQRRPLRAIFGFIALLSVLATVARAHDPYEITTRAFLYSNHLELRIEMEFPAAMLLAGQPGWRTNEISAAEQLSLAYPALAARAAGFLHVLTNGVPLPITSTNVALGVEDHVSFILWLPPVPPGALSFGIGELKQLSGHGPYGTSLTVLDMVQRRVLGQAVLFGDSAPFQISAAERLATNQTNNPSPVIRLSSTNLSRATSDTAPRPIWNGWWWLLVLAVGTLLLANVAIRRRK